MAHLRDLGIDADEIVPGLWQGSAPEASSYGADPQIGWATCFHVIVLAADNWQPSEEKFPGVEIVRSNMTDPLGPGHVLKAQALARDVVVPALQAGKKVLVSCHAGLNRSGLINTFALRLQGFTPLSALQHIQFTRCGSLFAPDFIAAAQSEIR